MALEYVILTLIALNGSWLWIKSAGRNRSNPLVRTVATAEGAVVAPSWLSDDVPDGSALRHVSVHSAPAPG